MLSNLCNYHELGRYFVNGCTCVLLLKFLYVILLCHSHIIIIKNILFPPGTRNNISKVMATCETVEARLGGDGLGC